MTDCELLRIDKKAMTKRCTGSTSFPTCSWPICWPEHAYEEDLGTISFNSSEKRLARVLLLLARFGKEGNPSL